jgi:RNA polymerase sigma-70 factor (ECF subfamily)
MSVSRAEFERLALEHIDMLYRVARRLSGNDAQAEDLVQDTYVRALRSWETFQLQDFGIRPWLIRILHNLFYSATRRDHRQPNGIDQDHLESIPESGSNGAPLLTDAFQSMDERLVRALNRLPGEYQLVMLLWAIEELSYKEIADSLDIPIGTVMSRLHRAKQKLAEQLTDLAKDNRILRE